jgi:hypothetical protein
MEDVFTTLAENDPKHLPNNISKDFATSYRTVGGHIIISTKVSVLQPDNIIVELPDYQPSISNSGNGC